MVKRKHFSSAKRHPHQGKAADTVEASRIGPATAYGTISERLSPFGGLLGLVKFLDLVKFEEIFAGFYQAPSRIPVLGHYNMVLGLLMLLFIGFSRVWHFIYIQLDSMLCSIFQVTRLPYVTTYWRYVNSLGLNQGQSLLRVIAALRERVWHLCDINFETIHIDIDTTVETVYGQQQGGRKGHNKKHRGKKGYRPVLCFIEETREYFTGKLRAGKTIGGKEFGDLIRTFHKYLPGCVKNVILRGDAEFMSWKSVGVAITEGYQFIFANKLCEPPFVASAWYKVRKEDTIEYNECMYTPTDWGQACRFVVMRSAKEEETKKKAIQLPLLEADKYQYRIFVTSLNDRPHKVIREYDKRADCENLVGEAKREGLEAIPSRKFANNYAFFQIVMLAYNIWRSFKMLAEHGASQPAPVVNDVAQPIPKEYIDSTIRLSRLKLLMISAKITKHANRSEVKYSTHDSRVENLFGFYRYLDKRRRHKRPWLDAKRWLSLHLSAIGASPLAIPT